MIDHGKLSTGNQQAKRFLYALTGALLKIHPHTLEFL